MNTTALFKQYILSILSFVGRDEKIIKTSRMNLNEIKKDLSKFKVDLELKEILRLISVTKQTTLKLCWSLLSFSGLRASDFLSLHYSDISKEKKAIYLQRRNDEPYHPKGMKLNDPPKRLPLNDISLEFFEQLQFRTGERIFPFTYKTLRQKFNKNIELAKITREAYPLTLHKLRHFFAHYFTKHKGTIQQLKSLLRHSDLKYTLLYSVPSEQELEIAYREVMEIKK